MSIKDELLKYFSQFQDSTGGYGINPKPQGQLNAQSPLGPQADLTPPDQTSNFGQLNPNIKPLGTGGMNQLDTMQNAMSNPIDAEKALGQVAEKPAYSDMQKQLIAKSIGSMGSQRMPSQPQLQMINAQKAFAQMPDATQPQQIQEFQPQQMAMMLRRKHGGQ
jgi:hypothetical protein